VAVLLGFSGIGVATIVVAQDIPDTLVRAKFLEDELFALYPEFDDGDNRYYFEELRPIQMPAEAWRWYRETKLCLQKEGKELTEHVSFNEIKWFEYASGWNFRDHRAVELRGAWFGKSIVLHNVMTGDYLEETIRHEMVHALIGLTTHPLTATVVGRCQPGLMLDSRKDGSRAEPTRTRRAFPWGVRSFRDERMGPRSPFGDGGVGGPGEQLGPMGLPGGDWIPQDVRRP
jgi:hypothetical protein